MFFLKMESKMRIISGKARGTKLYTLEGMETRPTLDRVKESLFNIIQNEIPESIFLDLFAGSGAIGLEAASRGAKKVILCEKSKDAGAIVRKNIEKTHLQDVVEFIPEDAEKFLKTKLKEKPDIIYFDPPYKTNLVEKTINILLEKDLLKKETMLIIETDQREQVEEELKQKKIDITDIRKYGRASLIFAKIR